MAIVTTDDKYYKEIADIIRETVDKYGDMAPGIIGTILDFMDLSEIKPARMVELLKLVSKYGVQVVEDHTKQSFWDNYQRKGLRTNYAYGFGGYGWHTNTFWPRYDIKPKGSAACLFFYFNQQAAAWTDLVERLDECGVVLDFANCTNFSNAFAYARFTRVGVIDTTGASDLTRIFANASITTVDELRLKPNGGQTFTNAFYKDSDKDLALVNIKVTGKITNSINLGQCRKLSAESIESFFEALSSTVSGKTITVSGTAVEYSMGTGSERWENIVASRPNWTVVLE